MIIGKVIIIHLIYGLMKKIMLYKMSCNLKLDTCKLDTDKVKSTPIDLSK